MLDILRTRIDTILDDREAERLLENIAYAIETALTLEASQGRTER
jgi:hypothetical protein